MIQKLPKNGNFVIILTRLAIKEFDFRAKVVYLSQNNEGKIKVECYVIIFRMNENLLNLPLFSCDESRIFTTSADNQFFTIKRI